MNMNDNTKKNKKLLRIYDIFSRYREIIMYLIFGSLTFLINVASYILFYSGCKMHELLANVLSWIIAVLFAYITNKKYVFKSKAKSFNDIFFELCTFCGGRLFTLAFEELHMFIFVTYLAYNSVLMKIIAQFIVIILNYIISKMFVFKNKEN